MPKLYEVMYASVNGLLLDEQAEVETDIVAKDTLVEVLPLDFAGFTPGPTVRMCKLKLMLPSDGPTFDFEGAKIRKQFLTVRLQRGGSGAMCQFRSYVSGNVSTTSGVGKNTEVSVELTGEPAEFV